MCPAHAVRGLRAAVAAVLVFAGVAAYAQQADRARLEEQIDRICKDRVYDAPRFGPARWLPDGTAYAIVERTSRGVEGSEIARYDAATGARTVLVAASQLVPRGAKAPLDIDDYTWSADGKRLLILRIQDVSGDRTRAATTGCSRSVPARSRKLVPMRPKPH